MRAFGKLFSAALKQFYRDRTNPTIMVLIPLLFIGFFGIFYADHGLARLAVGYVPSPAGGPLYARMGRALQADPALETHTGGAGELAALRRGDRQAVVTFAPGGPPLGRPATAGAAQVAYDAADATGARTVLALIDRDLLLAAREDLPGGAGLPIHRPVQGTIVRGIDFVVPGILALALMWLGIFSAIPLVIQREAGVLKRYGLTPVSRLTVVAAQGASRVVVALFQAALLLIAGGLLFHVPLRGSILALVGVVALGALTFVALGYLIAAFCPTQEAVHGWTQLVTFPMMLLAGIFFSVAAMPGFLQPLVLLLPLTYLADALRQIVLQSAGVAPLAVDILALALWALGATLLASRRFRWDAEGA